MDVWRAQGVLGAMPKRGRRILWIRSSVTVPRKAVSAAAALRRFGRADDGVTAIEYALLASLLAVAIIGAVTMAGSELKYTFESLTNSISEVNDSVSGGGGSGPEDPDPPEKNKDKDPCQQRGQNCKDKGKGRN